MERGYQVDRAVAVDQFPWTANCETIALLSKIQEKDKKNSAILYREEEISDCECIYG